MLENVFPVLLPRIDDDENIISEIPERADDLQIVYKVKMNDFLEDRIASIALNKNILDMLDIQVEDVKLRAVENFRRSVTIRSMGEVLSGILGHEDPELVAATNQMTVITDDKNFSAYGMVDEYTLNKVCEKMHTNSIIIIPSSIRGIIAVDGSMDESEINNMIRNINATEVRESERLSDHCYRYTRDPR